MANKTIKILLTIIALNITFITALELELISPVQAKVDGMSWRALENDADFKKAVLKLVTDNCRVANYSDRHAIGIQSGKVYCDSLKSGNLFDLDLSIDPDDISPTKNSRKSN